MTGDIEPNDGMLRRTLLKASAATAGALALSTSVSTGKAQEDDDSSESIEDSRIPYLDLDDMEADLEGETLQAEPYQDWRPGSTTYVGRVPGRSDRDLFVGVSLLDDTEQSDEDGQPEIVAYLCDGEPGTRDAFGLLLFGDYDTGGVTLSPESGEGVEVAEAKLVLVDGEFLGAATLSDEETVPFLAAEATGDAGLYLAEIDSDESAFVQWVVLPDGRQRGDEIVFDDLAGWTVE